MENLIEEIKQELREAKIKHPVWPENDFEQVCIITEEVGELVQAVLKEKWENGDTAAIKKEAIQVAAMCIRFLENRMGV